MEEVRDHTDVCPLCGYRNDTAANAQFLTPGSVLAGRYLVGRVLGAGGFGVTYLAWDEVLGRKIAVKEYFPGNLSTRVSGQTAITAFTGEKERIFLHGLERFQEEARLLMQFAGYDGIVSIYDVFAANGTAYIIMEYLEGATLGQRLKRDGPMGEEELLSCMVPMLLSLKFVHQLGYIHRDISPDNIMCLPDGTVKLLDFGAARYAVMEESQSLSVIIKQGFTPIEQYQSHGSQGPWTDIYAVGATMYHALTGAAPEESLERLTNDTLKSPAQQGISVSPAVESAVMTALNLHPEDRPQDIDAFLAILTGQEEGNVVRSQKKRLTVRRAVILLLALIGIVGITTAVIRLANRTDDSAEIIEGVVDVPNVIRKTIEEAEGILQELALSLRIENGRYFDADMVEAGYVELGQIMSQDPEGGKSAETGSVIGVEVSKGREQKRVPDILDMTAENAQEYLGAAGFSEDLNLELEEVPSEENMPGTVISQSVSAGSDMDFDGTIKLQISKGPETPSAGTSVITVADYTGEDFSAIKASLLEDGVYLVKSDAVYSPDFPAGTIIAQYPEPGTEVHAGGAAYAVVSLGVEYAQVPDLLYQSAEEAKQILAERGLSWRLEFVIDDLVALNHVVSQETEAGTLVPFGTEICLFVSGETEYTELPVWEEISFASEFLSVPRGESGQMAYVYHGSEPLIWASSNPSIVSVTQEGVFTAAGFGTATISVSAGGNVAVCRISVEDSGRISHPAEYQLEIGEQVPLASHIPEDILKQVVWRASNPATATVDASGLVSAVAEGFSCVTASYRDQVYAFNVFVMGQETYVEIEKALLSGSQSQAENTLRARGLTYTIQREFSATKARGEVTHIRYQGYSDQGNYYIERESDVLLYISSGKNEVSSVSIQTPPAKMSYPKGGTPDYTGMVLTVTYADGSTRAVSSGYTAPSDPLTSVPSQSVNVSYGGKTAPLTFTVQQERTLKIASPPSKTTYTAGEAVDTTGLVLSYTDSSGRTSEVRRGFEVVGSTGKAGRQPVTVKYEGLSVSYTITVKEAEAPVVELPKVEPVEEKPLEEKLSIKSKPSTTSYYVGDSLNTKGLVLSYTDSSGKTTDVKSGFETSGSTGTAGKRTVTVKYRGLTAAYDITVSEPLVAVSYTEEAGDIIVYARTVPAGQHVTWSSSDESVFYFDGSNFIIRSSGTATALASITYNGMEYTGSCEITVEAESRRYSFEIIPTLSIDPNSYGEIGFSLHTDIPRFDVDGVRWSISDTSLKTEQRQDTFYVYEGTWHSFTVTASYEYNGITYTDSYSNEAAERERYTFSIADAGHSNGIGRYTIQTTIPGFSADLVTWSASDYKVWAEGNSLFVDESAMSYGESYTLSVSCVYNGATYSDQASYTCNSYSVDFWSPGGDSSTPEISLPDGTLPSEGRDTGSMGTWTIGTADSSSDAAGRT